MKRRIFTGIEDIASELEVSKTKCAALLAENIVPSLITGGETRKNYNTTGTLIDHAREIISLSYGVENPKNPFSVQIKKEELTHTVDGCVVLTVTNQKGGVGKTTSTVNIAASLAELGQKVLLVDMDSQAQTSSYLRDREYNNESIRNIFKIIQEEGKLTKEDVEKYILTIDTGSKGNTVDLLPSEIRLGRMLEVLRTSFHPETFLKDILDFVREDYDFIVIDTPPSAGLALQLGIYAADKILLVSRADRFSITPLIATIEEIEMLNKHIEREIKIDAVLVNQYKDRETLQKKIMNEIIDVVINRLYLEEDGLIVQKYAASIIETSQYHQLAVLSYKKKVKETLIVSDPFFQYASKLIISKITTAMVRGEK